MRDDSGRSPHIELDLERSFDGALSRRSVYEQTSWVLRHRESVQDESPETGLEAQLREKVQRTARPPAQLQPQAQTARSKALSRMGTTVIETQGSAEGVVAGSVFEAYIPDCRKSRFGQTLRGSSSSAGRLRHESEELFAIELDLD